jgi:hypothetical protein
MSVRARLHHRRPGISFRKTRWHASRLEQAAVVVGSALLILAVTLLVLALLQTLAARGPSNAVTATDAATPLMLPGVALAFEERGIVYAPSSYAPPGIWTPKAGPGPVR